MASGPERRPLSPTVLWLSIGFFFLFAGAAQQQFQSPFWRDAVGWQPIRRSVILAVVYLSFGFWRLQIGHFIRAWGEKPVLLLGAATYALFCAAVYLTTSFWLLILAAALWGWGGAANWGTSSVMVLDATKDRRYGSNVALLNGLTRVGFALGVWALNLVFVAGRNTGDPSAARSVWLWAALISMIGVACLAKVPAREVDIDPPSLPDQIAMMRSPKGAIGSLFLFLGGLGFGVMLSILADHLASGMPGGNALYIGALFALAGGLAVMIGGPLSDRFGRPLSLFLTFAAAAVGLFLAWRFPGSVAALAVCATLLGVQGGLVPTLTLAMIGDSTASRQRQNAYGALFFWRDMGVAGSLLLSQWLHQKVSIRPALLVLAIVSVGCAALCIVLARRAEEGLVAARRERSPGLGTGGRAFCRAAAVTYALVMLLPAAWMLVVLPVVAALANRLPGRRKAVDPWWPITSWLTLAGTLPRLAIWLERCLTGPDDPPDQAASRSSPGGSSSA